MEIIISVVIAVALLHLGINLRKKVSDIAKNGVQTEGVVFDTVQNNSVQSSANYPIIRFVTLEKVRITEKYNISAVPGYLKKGQKVTVIYNADNPREFFVKSKIIGVVPGLVIALAIIILIVDACKILQIKL